jgi:hypothetical protein
MNELIQELYIKYAGRYDIQIKMQCDIIEYLYQNDIEGDILEIGAHEGNHTVYFLEIAKKYNKKVYVVDPYNGEQQGDETIYNIFINRTNKYDNLVYLRNASQSEEFSNLINEIKFAYIFINGLHTIPALESDILISEKHLIKNGIICIDDCEMEGFYQLYDRIYSEYDNLAMIDKPASINNTRINDNIRERMVITGHNLYGIYNPGHKKVEYLIKK